MNRASVSCEQLYVAWVLRKRERNKKIIFGRNDDCQHNSEKFNKREA